MPIVSLKRVLDQKFGIVAASVEVMSVTHPMFVREGAWVRLRREDNPMFLMLRWKNLAIAS